MLKPPAPLLLEVELLVLPVLAALALGLASLWVPLLAAGVSEFNIVGMV
ncbi:MAG: hypothetical protein WAK26_07645 [Terracidiphilus sp.]